MMPVSSCRSWFFIASWLLLLASARDGKGITIDVGRHVLQPNQAGQNIIISVTDGGSVAGLNFYAQVGDGGPETALFGLPAGTDGPAITSVDLKTDTIFSASTSFQDDQPAIPQIAISSIEFSNPGQFVNAQGRLAQLTVDTTGFRGGRWDLKLSGVLAGFAGGPFSTDFAGIPAQIINGYLDIIPELAGDFNDDGVVNATDIDALALVIRLGNGTPLYDLNLSSTVDGDDFDFLITDILETFPGDANLDHAIDSTDLSIWNSRRFTAGAGWLTGDFNGDGLSDVTDFNLWNRHRGLSAAPAMVPEPSAPFFWVSTLVIAALLSGVRSSKMPI